MSLEHAYKHLPAECVIWRVGQGRTQPVTLLPKGRFRNIINSCWREGPQKRPTFTQLLVILEETVRLVGCKNGMTWNMWESDLWEIDFRLGGFFLQGEHIFEI